MIDQSISFLKPIPTCSIYLILFSDQIVGSIFLEQNDNTITNIDMNGKYFDNIKNILIDRFLYELGINTIDLVCDPVFFDYYNELGFKKCEVQSTDGKVVLRYKVKMTLK